MLDIWDKLRYNNPIKILRGLKMEITIDEIKHLASLSRLEFKDSELEKFKNEFQAIIDYVNQLQSVDTTKAVDQTEKHFISDLREDVVGQSLSNEEVLKNAKHSAKGAFLVPRVVE